MLAVFPQDRSSKTWSGLGRSRSRDDLDARRLKGPNLPCTLKVKVITRLHAHLLEDDKIPTRERSSFCCDGQALELSCMDLLVDKMGLYRQTVAMVSAGCTSSAMVLPFMVRTKTCIERIGGGVTFFPVW